VPGTTQPISEIKAELFKALSHPARVRVLEVLADGEHSVSELQPLVEIESSHLSQQLAVLRRAGLVTARKEGSSVHYSIRDPLTVELLRVAKQLLINALAETSDLLSDLRSV
jgi:ArsR family transcriptional regulator